MKKKIKVKNRSMFFTLLMALVRLYTFNIKTEPKGLKRVGHKKLKVPIVYGA